MANYLDKTGLISVIQKLKAWAENNFASKEYVEELNDKIPTDEHVNTLINSALEVIEDGYY